MSFKHLWWLLLILLWPHLAWGGEKMDIVFLIDSSQSMVASDPQKFRQIAVKAFVDITQDRGGDRIAIYQFAGWHETDEHNPLVYPLTTIPSDEKERAKLLGVIKTQLDAKVKPFGRDTDFNYALGRCLDDVKKIRSREKTSRKLWIILLSDGDMSVGREGKLRGEYERIAQSKWGDVNLETLNKAALEVFRRDVLPQLKRENIYVSPIFLTTGGRNNNQVMETIVGQTKGPGQPLRATGDNLKSVFLKALTSPPGDIYRPQFTKATHYQKSTVPPRGKVKDPFTIYQGTRQAKILVFANHPGFLLDVVDGEGTSFLSTGRLKITGQGEPYRVISIEGLPPGQYFLNFSHTSTEQATYERLIFYEFGFSTHLKVLNETTPLHPTEQIHLEVGLTSPGDKNAFIKDRGLLKHLQGEVVVKNDRGQAVIRSTASFGDLKEARSRVRLVIPADLAPGRHRVEFTCYGLLTHTKQFAYTSPTRWSHVKIVPLLNLRFGETRAFVSRPVKVTGEFSKGRLAPRKFTAVALWKDGDKEEKRSIVISPGKEGSPTFEGEFTPNRKGTWKLQTIEGKDVHLVPYGVGGKVEIESRRLILMVMGKNDQWQETDKLELKPVEEQGKPLYFRSRFALQAHIPKGEKARGKLAVDIVPSLEKESKISLEPSGERKFPEPGQEIFTLTVTPLHPAEMEGKKIRLSVKSHTSEGEVIRHYPLEVNYSSPFSPLWYVLAGLLGLVIFLASWRFLAPPLIKHQVMPLHISTPGEITYYLANYPRGFRGNQARGFPDCPDVLDFRLGGLRWITRPTMYAQGSDDDQILVEERIIRHGGVIQFERAGEIFCYLYFDQDPTVEEKEELIARYDPGIYLSDDEFVLVED